MIDPVRLGPVSPVAAKATASTDVRRSMAASITVVPERPSEVATGANLPRLLDLVADLSRAGPPIDYAKIAQVRRAIADGSYRIDANELAKAILGFARQD
jgi:negative regulator of flagellin synthesis FlgM